VVTIADSDFSIDDVADKWGEVSSSNELVDLPDNFYKEGADYLESLEDAIENAGKSNDKEQKRLVKLYTQTNDMLSRILKKRQRKILEGVHHSLIDQEVDLDKLTEREREVFNRLLEEMEDLTHEKLFGTEGDEYERR